jgi:hypothetical protein
MGHLEGCHQAGCQRAGAGALHALVNVPVPQVVDRTASAPQQLRQYDAVQHIHQEAGCMLCCIRSVPLVGQLKLLTCPLQLLVVYTGVTCCIIIVLTGDDSGKTTGTVNRAV